MIKSAREIARRAGKAIIDIYTGFDGKVDYKNDPERSPLTKADLLSDNIIKDGLRQVSSFPIVTEESYVEYDKRKDWQKFWLVDPLDGTKDFLARNGEFTINIALIEDEKPVLGVVYAPAIGLEYYALCGGGAYCNGVKIYNHSKRTRLIGADSQFHSTPATVDFFIQNKIEEIKRFGSALKFGKLAEGVVDVYPRFNGSKEWDTAAGQIILQESGCKLCDLATGCAMAYNKPKIENSFFIACRKDLYF